MAEPLAVTISVPEGAERAFRRMGRALDAMVSLAAGNRGRYETSTNAYEASLEAEFAAWVKRLSKVTGTADEKRASIETALAELQRTLQDLGQETLPDALYVLGHNYIPSPDAFGMIADAIRENNLSIGGGLIPELREKLLRALDEETDLGAVAQSLASRVTRLAGLYWSTIQRAIGDFAQQAATADDEVYPCRWVLDPGAEHCESCSNFAGTYDSYNAMLDVTNESVPGYFFNSPYKSCFSNCRCHLELKINGVWVRV